MIRTNSEIKRGESCSVFHQEKNNHPLHIHVHNITVSNQESLKECWKFIAITDVSKNGGIKLTR